MSRIVWLEIPGDDTEKQEIPSLGPVASCTDAEGNRFDLVERVEEGS